MRTTQIRFKTKINLLKFDTVNRKFPELLAWFRIFIGHKEPNNVDQQQSGSKDRSNNEMTMEIDFSTCKRYGASYRALPKTFNQPKCSGRSALCKEVILF